MPGVRIVRLVAWCALLLCTVPLAAQQPFRLAPALAVEAEDFTVERGWSPIRIGEGNYAVDIIGFSHTSGERFLHCAGDDAAASAYLDVTAPAAGPYRLWVRYEYMPFTETRFKAVVEQHGRVVAEKVMGTKESPRVCPWSDGTKLDAQYDPPWGNEGITEEPMDVPALEAGPARLRLLAVAQPQVQGVTANRNIDCLYLTSDAADLWRQQPAYKTWYGILYAFLDTLGARYEVQYVNTGDKPLNVSAGHAYNRIPWGMADPAAGVANLAPGASSAWLPLRKQDTSHSSMAWFTPGAAQPFTVAVRPIGGAVEETVLSTGDNVGIFLPAYPGKGEKAIVSTKAIDRILAALKAAPAPGKTPTLPLCYGGSMPYEQDNAYGRKYAELFAALGLRNTGPFVNAGPNDPAKHYKNLKAVGLGPTRSATYMEYRFPPTPENIAKAKDLMTKSGALQDMRWFDYGDEIGFGEWFSYMVEEKRKELNNPKLTVEEMILPLWQAWLQKNRKGFAPQDYWRAGWGALTPAKLRPDASAEAAAEKPKLYVDSVLFYEDTSIDYVAKGAKAVKAAFGEQVLPGCNYSCYPYYYPHTPMYVKWFRRGAAEKGQQSEYFWQLGQVTPMINGFVAEYFRAGMRFNPRAILKQYTMPHAPGNTDASFRRTAFTHLAHGAKNLDFFGTGMNETFTENYIDYRATDRFVAVRDITNALGLVEDVWEAASIVPSEVALLVSESTERWDHAKVASDHLTTGQPARNFRDSRLTYHQDRVGIYTALTFAGYGVDLVVEEDLLNPAVLNGYKALVVVGDCLPPAAAKALEGWVKRGGLLFATAGAGRFDSYRQPSSVFDRLLGVADRRVEERETFLRTSQELPFIKPISSIAGKDGSFPALAVRERFTPAKGSQLLANFTDPDNAPAVAAHKLGKGRVVYAATLPGLSYLWTGLQPPQVPDRGPAAHRAVTTYDRVAAGLLTSVLAAAGVQPRLVTTPDYLDARLIRAAGAFLLPLANYNQQVGQPATVRVRPPAGAGVPTRAVSAFCGQLPVTVEQGAWVVTIPTLGYGDMLRIDVR